MKKLTFFLLALLFVFSFSLNAQDEASCNYAAVDWVGNESANEHMGIYYVNVESYSPAGTSDDGYSANINVNGVSYPLINDGVNGNNIGWYYGISVVPGGTYNWSVTIETCGGGPAAVSGSYTFHFYGCTYNMGLNYSPANTTDDGSCVFEDWALPVGCMDATADNYMVYATSEGPDTQCIYDGSWNGQFSSGPAGAPPVDAGGASGPGCTLDEGTTNYNSNATSDDGSCILEDWALPVGCMDTLADNYMVYATNEGPWEMGLGDDPCIFDGSWNGLFSQPAPDMPGCMDLAACNYAPHYNVAMNESCVFAASGYDCANVCLADADADGVCDEFEVAGCTDSTASNYSSSATDDDASCEFIGCMDASACNYDVYAQVPAACSFPDLGFDCQGGPVALSCDQDNVASYTYGNNDETSFTYSFATSEIAVLRIQGSTESCCDDIVISDKSGVVLSTLQGPFDETIISNDNGFTLTWDSDFSVSGYSTSWALDCAVYGCDDPIAENYNINAHIDDGSCTYIFGCMDSIAENYNSLATVDDTSCTYIYGCTDVNADNYDSLVTVAVDSSCVYSLVQGCTDSLACNFDSLAQQDDASCYNNDLGCGCDQPAAADGYDCDGNLIPLVCGDTLNVGNHSYSNNDRSTFDYIFDSSEIAMITISGRTEANYDFVRIRNSAGDLLQEFDGFFSGTVFSDDNGITVEFYADGLYAYNSPATSWSLDCAVQGCNDTLADNYDSLANYNDGSCVLSVTPGCMDSVACNYNPSADVNDGSCNYPQAGLDCDGNCLVGDFVSFSMASGYGYGFYGASYNILSDGESIASGPSSSGYWSSLVDSFCAPTDCYQVVVSDPYASWVSPTISWSFGGASGGVGTTVFASLGDSCVSGCNDLNANNYDSVADIVDNSLCTYDFVQGCTDSLSCNYDTLAEQDNGSCSYPPLGFDCDGNSLQLVCGDSTEASYTYVNNDDQSFSYNLDSNELAVLSISYSTESCCDDITVSDGSGLTLATLRGNGTRTIVSNDNGISLTWDSDGSVTGDYASIWSIDCAVLGCTDLIAENFDSLAQADNGSCTYIYGCLDTLADNYDTLATASNDSCIYSYTCSDHELFVDSVSSNVGSLTSWQSPWHSFTMVADGSALITLNANTVTPEFMSTSVYSDCEGTLASADSLPAGDYYVHVSQTADIGSVDYVLYVSPVILGCTDAFTSEGLPVSNYDSLANTNDGSCNYVYGCSDVIALNYDALVNIDDGSCDYVYGCMDDEALNFNSGATMEYDPSSCQYATCPNVGGLFNVTTFVDGDSITVTLIDVNGQLLADVPLTSNTDFYSTDVCMIEGIIYTITSQDLSASGSSSGSFSLKTCDNQFTVASDFIDSIPADGLTFTVQSCDSYAFGCTDSIAENFDPNADTDNNTCQYIYGCMSETACNYDSTATVDDESCYNNDVGCGCDQPAAVDGYDCNGDPIPLVCGDTLNSGSYTYSNNDNTSLEFVFDSGEVAVLSLDYSTESGWDDLFVYDGAGVLLASLTGYGTETIMSNDNGITLTWDSDFTVSGYTSSWSLSCAVFGCMDPIAENYDSLATYVDSSCTYIYGCTDPFADNYDSLATVLDSCIYSIPTGCMDSLACNFDSLAEEDNGTCYNNDLGCGCDQPAAAYGFDCDGNPAPIACGDSTISSYTYDDNDNTSFSYEVDSNEIAVLSLNYSTESGWDDLFVYDGAGVLLASLTGSGTETIMSNDNGITLTWDTDGSVSGYTSSWSIDCAPSGCTDGFADNYDSLALIEDSSCTYSVIPGCMDSVACNYSALADTSDGSCTYPPFGYDCDGNCLEGEEVTFDMTQSLGNGFNGATYTVSLYGEVIASGPSNSGDWYALSDTFCAVPSCYEVYVSDIGYWSEYYYGAFGDLSWSFGDASGSYDENAYAVLGQDTCIVACADSFALNFNPDAVYDDGSCEYTPSLTCDSSTSISINSSLNGYHGSQLWYSFVLDTLQIVDASVTSGSLALYSACDSLSLEAPLTFGLLDEGTYFINVSSFSSDSSGYTITLNSTAIPPCDGTQAYLTVEGSYYGTWQLAEDGILLLSQDEVYSSTDILDIRPVCLKDGSVYTMSAYGSYNGWSGSTYSIEGECSGDSSVTYVLANNQGLSPNNGNYSYSPELESQESFTAVSCDSLILGCMDTIAENFNPLAHFAGGDSCQYIYGCMDTIAENYDSLATQSSGACVYIPGCTDTLGNNYSADATENDGSCDYSELISCSDSVAGSYSYTNYDDEYYDYELVDSGEVVELTISYSTEFCCDDITVRDGSGVILQTLRGDGFETIVSNDNGITLTWDSDGSVNGNYPTVWSIGCAVQGCTNQIAENFDSLAQVDNGSCTYIYGCMDTIAENYDSLATVSNDSCEYIYGCMDLNASNYDSLATVEPSDSVCVYLLAQGCMDSLACNFDTLAEEDDGSCYNNDLGCGCDLPAAVDGYDCDGNLIPLICGDTLNSFSYTYGSLDHSEEFAFDSAEVAQLRITGYLYSSWWSGSDYVYVYDGAGNSLATLSGSFDETILSNDNGIQIQWSPNTSGGYTHSWTLDCAQQGCMDPFADNYDPSAVVDDSSCVVTVIPGCMDSVACNYSALADTSDGSCTYSPVGFDCDGNCLQGYPTAFNMTSQYGYGFAGATYVLSQNGEIIAQGPSESFSYALTDTFCVVDGCVDVFVSPTTSTHYEITWATGDNSGSVDELSYAGFGDVGCIGGCTDPNANNIDSLADFADNSLCTYDFVQGCTDSLACNFDSLAEQDNGSCYNNDLGCGCDQPAAAYGFDCDGNPIPIACGDSTISSYTYDDNDNTSLSFALDSNEVAVLSLEYSTESGWDDLFVYDGAGVLLASLTGSDIEIIVSNDNGITLTWDTDGSVSGYTSSWSIDCVPQGCMDAIAENYDSLASLDDGSCTYIYGCTDPFADNYDSLATALDSCIYSIPTGCMDSLACNFDSLAEEDNGSCYNNDLGCGCDQPAAAYGFDCDGNPAPIACGDSTISSYTYDDNDNTSFSYEVDSNEIAVLSLNYSTESGWDDLFVYDGAGVLLASLTGSGTETIMSNDNGITLTWDTDGSVSGYTSSWSIDCAPQGCTNTFADNYDSLAVADDGSCILSVTPGCMDSSLACNFDSLADVDDGSCTYPDYGFDCAGNIVPLTCGSSLNSYSYTYVDYDNTSFDYILDEGEIASLSIDYDMEQGYDYINVFDGAGIQLAALTGYSSQTIISNDNGITVQFTSDGFTSAASSSWWNPIYSTDWSIDCAVQGCTDPDADNYNSAAVVDDGTCVSTCPEGQGLVAVLVTTDTHVGGETSYTLTGDNGFNFSYDFTFDDNITTVTEEFCIDNGTSMTFELYDSQGDGLVPPGGYEIQVCEQSLTGFTQFISSSLAVEQFDVLCGDIYGCNDSTALNYDVDVTVNDGSCDYPCLGLEAVVTHTGSSQFATEQSWYIMNTSTSQTIASGPNAADWGIGSQEVDELCLTEGAEYMLYMLDSQGDGWNSVGSGGSISIESTCGVLVENAEGTASVSSETFTACVVNSCPAPDSWATTVTGSNHTIVITSGSIVSLLDGNTLDHANVGVFFTDSLGNLVCAGSTQVSPGETAAIAAMGDDTTTPEVDGLVAGEEFMWMIADCHGNVFAASATYSPISVDAFVVNGVSYVTAITEASEGPSSQVIDLPNGWSMFSTYMIADDMDMESVLAPIIDDVVIAKNNSGSAYLVEWNFNGVGSLLVGQGYQIKTEAAVSLEISGAYATPEDHSVALSAGWNMIGYLRTESAAADAVLADIDSTGNLIIAKDYNGQAYLPEWNFNGIGTMNPGEGYQLKTNNADVLQFLSNDESYRMSTVEVIENNVSHFAKVVPTDNNMTVVIEDAAWDVLPSEGAEIAAFDKDGNQVGSAIYSSPATVIAVWGDDATSSSKDGLAVSEPVSFKVWNTNDVRDFTVSKWIEGSSSYQVDAINIASSIETHTIMTELDTSERVLVRVVNVLGQEVNMDDEPFKGTVLFKVYDDGSVERYVR